VKSQTCFSKLKSMYVNFMYIVLPEQNFTSLSNQFMFLKPLIVTCHSIKQFHYTCSSIISFLCCDFIVLISTYHSLIFFTIAPLHFISSIQFKICCQDKSLRCSSLENTCKTLQTVLCVFNHSTIILLFP